MKSAKLAILVLSICVLILGCSSTSRRQAEWQQSVSAPRTIALMPVRNVTDSSAGVVFVENVVPETLRAKGYEISSAKDTRAELDAAGFSSTELVWKTPVSALGKAISSDGMMFVSVEKWQKKYELNYSDAKVMLAYVLYNKAGKKLWSFRQEVFSEPGNFSTPGTGNVISDAVLLMVGGLMSHGLTDMEKLAIKANDLALNSGNNPLPNFR